MSKIFEIVKISEMAEKLLVVDISVDMFKNSKDTFRKLKYPTFLEYLR